MNNYNIREVDGAGEILAEHQLTADNYDGVLRKLRKVAHGATKIEVYDEDGKMIGGALVEFWRQKVRRR